MGEKVLADFASKESSIAWLFLEMLCDNLYFSIEKHL
jgi:hypothetical protein